MYALFTLIKIGYLSFKIFNINIMYVSHTFYGDQSVCDNVIGIVK